MGYYTKYELKSDPDIIGTTEFKEKFNKICGWSSYVLEESLKWYRHEENMREISKSYSATLFLLSGEGEESGDIWRKYFWNGKMQYCEAIVTFEEFDVLKLK